MVNNKHGQHIIKLDDKDLVALIDKNIRVSCNKTTRRPQAVLITEKGDKNGKILSRILLSPPKNMVVDHINRNPLDNRRSNLRVCTQRQNTRNKTKQRNNTSGIPSVEWQKDANMWRVRLKYLGNKVHIGYFKNKSEAGYVRDQAIIQLHGEFAKTYTI